MILAPPLAIRYRPLLPALLVAGAAACGREAPSVSRETNGAARPDSVHIQVRHARHFQVEYRDGYKIVRTHGEVTEFQSTDAEERVEDVMVLVPRGSAPPSLEGDLAGALVIATPARTLAVNNDDMLALVDGLGLRDQLRAVGGLNSYDDTVRARAAHGAIGQIRYSWHLPPDIEVLLAFKPEVVFLAVDAPGNVPALARVRDLGIAAAPSFVWAEPDYLGRAEWIKYFALFFDREAEANRIFDEVERRVAQLRDLAAQAVDTPVVAWGYHAGGGRWFMATNNLEASFVRDAGGRNPFENFGGPHRPDGEQFSNEQVLLQARDAQHWIIGDIHGPELPPERFMRSFRAWRDGTLYHNYARAKRDANAYDWYEGAVARPDAVLADLISLIHPELLPRHKTVFLGHFTKNGDPP